MKADKRGAEEFCRRFNEAGQYLRGTALFFFDLQAQPVGAVKSHFDPCEKSHEEQGKNKEYDRIHGNHTAKIVSPEGLHRRSPGSGDQPLLSKELAYQLFSLLAGFFQFIVDDDMIKTVLKGHFIGGFADAGADGFR